MKRLPALVPELFAGATVERWDINPDDYQAERDHVRRTHLELLRKSARLYEHRVVNGNSEPETKALRLGRALHVAVLQPAEAERLLVREPAVRRQTNAGKAELRAWRSELPEGAIVLSYDEQQLVVRMADALRRDPLAGPLLEREGETELPLRWTDPESGLPCKCMLDKYFETRDRAAVRVLDLKTTADPRPEEFAKSVAKYGYHRQDAMYRDAASRFAGGRPCSFIFLAVRSAPPFEVAVFDLDDQAVAIGRRQIRAALRQLADHAGAGDWRSRWQGVDARPTTLSLPAYALKDASA